MFRRIFVKSSHPFFFFGNGSRVRRHGSLVAAPLHFKEAKK
jgi:hypothetical protein